MFHLTYLHLFNPLYAGERRGLSVWIWLLLGILGAAFLWWFFDASRRKSKPQGKNLASETPAQATQVEQLPSKQTVPIEIDPVDKGIFSLVEDDLTIIEGIGPKINELLHSAGIHTLAQLGKTDLAQLRQILLEARLRIADPTTWPEQARLAANAEWTLLKTLQGQLKGGRKVS